MIKKLKYGWQSGGGYVEPTREVMCDKINEIIDTIYDMQLAISNLDPDSDWYDGQTRSENVQPDTKTRSENVQDPVCFISTTYPSDNKTTVFLGQKGASVEFNQPLPAGFMITIKEN